MSPLCHQTKTTTSKDRRKFLKILIGVERFELSTPCSQSRCANRTALHPVMLFPRAKYGAGGLVSSEITGGMAPPYNLLIYLNKGLKQSAPSVGIDGVGCTNYLGRKDHLWNIRIHPRPTFHM